MKLRYSIAASLMAISVATIVPAPAQAQQITTGIEGQVHDDAGAAIGGATVVITDTRTGAARTITTAADGRFFTTGPTTSEEHTSELQSLIHLTYAGFCLAHKIHTHPQYLQE